MPLDAPVTRAVWLGAPFCFDRITGSYGAVVSRRIPLRKDVWDRLIRGYSPANFRSYSRVAQVVEQVTVNHRVGGSSPSSGAVIRPAVASTYQNGHFRKGVPVLLSAGLLLDSPMRRY